MIKVSKSARKKVSQLMEEDGFSPVQDFVRVGVKSGGCSGLSYDLTFDKSNSSRKTVFSKTMTSRLLVDKKSLLYLCWGLR